MHLHSTTESRRVGILWGLHSPRNRTGRSSWWDWAKMSSQSAGGTKTPRATGFYLYDAASARSCLHRVQEYRVHVLAATGRMTPLRRPRDALGGMNSGAPSLQSPSSFPSRSDMMARRLNLKLWERKCINPTNFPWIKFVLVVYGCH